MIIEIKYRRWRPARSLLRLFGADVMEKLSGAGAELFLEGFIGQEYEARAVKAH
jgi:hypothetical protein